MSSPNHNLVSVSTPGKVLIAGGYAVLESPNIAITISVTARFYSTISLAEPNEHLVNASPNNFPITVLSPQFNCQYVFNFDSNLLEISQLSASGNPFIENCLLLVFKFAVTYKGLDKFNEDFRNAVGNNMVTITLQADNDFYSHIKQLIDMELPLLSSSLKAVVRFSPCPIDKDGKISKTGMGSSATLTTSLVASLLQFFDIVNLRNPSDHDLMIVHNVSQLAHSIAQGKIGSGFDVSAAVYGSQIYSRFDASRLNLCMSRDCSANTLRDMVVDPAYWTQTKESFALPPSFNIIMGDVNCGAESSSMARNVLQWKDSCQSGKDMWKSLSQTNTRIRETFASLSSFAQLHPDDYEHINAIQSEELDSLVGDISTAILYLRSLRTLFREARHILRTIGNSAGVDIEPKEQTELIDATELVDGVLCCGVPGAGGRDAVFCLTFTKDARDNVEKLWSTWSSIDPNHDDVCPLCLEATTELDSAMRLESLDF